MKKRSAHWLRSALCLMLAVLLAAGTCVTAFAATESEETNGAEETKDSINYVSIGDSMTNGYGFVGYNQDSDDLNVYDFLTGAGMYGAGAYPLQFEAYLAKQGYAVSHTKLAPSALLAGDFWFLLGGRDEPEDEWGGFRSYVGKTYKTDDTKLKEHFQAAVAEADVMTVCLGNAEFGAYLLNRITDALGVLGGQLDEDEKVTLQAALSYSDLDSEQRALVQKVYDLLVSELKNYIPDDLWTAYNVQDICNLLAYTSAGFLVNYKGSLDAIVELNSDVEIIQVGLMNTTYGMKVTMDDGSYIPVGDIMDSVFGLLNAYIAGLPTVMQLAGEWEDATFYYAEQPNPLFISQQFAALKEVSWGTIDGDRLSGQTVRSRNIDAYNSSLRTILGSAFSELLGGNELPKITLTDVADFEAYSLSNTLKCVSCAVYLGLEDAVAESCNTMDIPLSGLQKIAGDLSSVFSGFTPSVDYSGNNGANIYQLRTDLGNYLTSTDEMKGMCMIYALFKVGNGMSVHPTPSGHDNIAASVIAAYEANHTSKDQTLENVEALLAELCKLVEAYGPEVAQQVWQQWVEYGYVDMVETSIEELYEMLAERYEYYTTEALPAIEASVAELTAEKDELVAQLAELNAQLEVAREQLAAAVEAAAAESTEAAEALKAELETAVAELTGAIASIETMLSEIELELDALAELAENIAATVAEMEQTLVDVSEAVAELKNVFEDVVTILSEAANSSAAVLDTVIASFQAARDTAVAAAEVVSVTMTVATELADDIDTMIEKVVTDGTALYEKFVNEVPGCFDVLVGYYEMLPAELREMIEAALAAAVEAGKDALESETQEKLEELEKTYGPEIEAKKAELEALIAEIEAAIAAKKAELEAAYDAALAELEAQKVELEAQLAAKKAELEQLAADAAQEVIDEINAKIAEIEAAVDAVEAAIAEKQAELEAAIAQITAEVNEQYASAVAALESAIAELQNAYDAAAAELQNALAVAIAELEAAVAEQLEDLSAEAFEQIEGYLAELSDQLENTKAVLAAIAAGSIESVEEMVAALEALGAAALEDINAAVEELIDTVNAMLYQATHADIEVEDELKYVALGDGSAVEEGYVEILAAMIEKQLGDEIICVNNAAVGNTVADELDDLQALAAKVYDADLVTLGYSDVTFLVDAFNVLYYQGGNVDWSDYVEDEYIPYIEQLVDEIQAELVESMGDEATAAMVTTLANAMAFSAVQYAVELPMLAAAIHEINPEAVIVIVGMYNPLADVTLDLGGSTIDVGEYVDYLVDAVAVHGLAYSLISGSSIYVDARDVATNLSSTTLSKDELAALLYTQFAAMYPSAAGDQYIAEKIADALNISYTRSGLLGDADSDGKITTYDATLILQYKSGRIDASQLNLAVCDVDGDGKITTYDATLILQYKSGRIEKFPAEA